MVMPRFYGFVVPESLKIQRLSSVVLSIAADHTLFACGIAVQKTIPSQHLGDQFGVSLKSIRQFVDSTKSRANQFRTRQH